MTEDNVTEWVETNDIEGIRYEVEELVTNILSQKKNESVLQNIYDQPCGRWLELLSLCKNQFEINARLENIEHMINEKVYVTWINSKEPEKADGFSSLVFFVNELGWSTVAFYNRKLLQKSNT
ncbi:MAG: hypothetical protein AAF587_44005 [Bacteroidota bacterium]